MASKSESESQSIAVIGAGIMGLSCARLAAMDPRVKSVTIYAKDFSPNVTSDGAGGKFHREECFCSRALQRALVIRELRPLQRSLFVATVRLRHTSYW